MSNRNSFNDVQPESKKHIRTSPESHMLSLTPSWPSISTPLKLVDDTDVTEITLSSSTSPPLAPSIQNTKAIPPSYPSTSNPAAPSIQKAKEIPPSSSSTSNTAAPSVKGTLEVPTFLQQNVSKTTLPPTPFHPDANFEFPSSFQVGIGLDKSARCAPQIHS